MIRIIILKDDIEWKKWEDIVFIIWKNVKCLKKYIFINVYFIILCIFWRKFLNIYILEIINLLYIKFDVCILIVLIIIIYWLKWDNFLIFWNYNKELNSGLLFLSCIFYFKF